MDKIYTPEELAKAWKVSLLTVYKLLNQNKIPHFRVGRAYRIPQNYLEFYMQREGNIGFFEQDRPILFPREIEILLTQIKKEPRQKRENILEVRLFGSYARGNTSTDSDIDILMVVKKLDSKTDRWIAKLSEKVMADSNYHHLLSILRLSKGHWEKHRRLKSPLYEEIERDGKLLWPTMKS